MHWEKRMLPLEEYFSMDARTILSRQMDDYHPIRRNNRARHSFTPEGVPCFSHDVWSFALLSVIFMFKFTHLVE